MTIKTNKLIITNTNATAEQNVILASGAGNIDINKVLKLSAAASFTANGSATMILAEGSTLGPNGHVLAGSAIAKWLTVQDSNGSNLYIPAWL